MNPTENVTPNSQNPHYRIGAVAKLSGVPVTTLRVWEIRYGALSTASTVKPTH